MPRDVQQVVSQALANPKLALAQLDKLRAERRLIDFVRLTWPVIEPGRKFVEGWPLHAIAEHLEAVSSGQIKRLLINVPPGFSKSLFTCVFWPAWMWGPANRPSTRFMCAAYSEALTVRDNLRCRRLLESPEYQFHWGDRFKMTMEQNAKVKFDNDKTGFKIATSVAGLGTGERADVFVVDDPHSVREVEYDAKREAALQWFSEVVPTRLNDPGKSAIVVIMQRVHERDVSGLIIAEELGYDHLMIPMEFEPDHPHLSKTALGFVDPRRATGELCWPERFSAEYLDGTLKKELRGWGGSYAEAGQLQQRPVARGGGMFKESDFVMVNTTDVPKGGRVCRGWDLAATEAGQSGRAAFTVGAKVRLVGGRLFVEDVVREQAGPFRVEQLLQNAAKADGTATWQSIPQDPGQAGKAQKSRLAGLLQGHLVHFSTESGSKEDRARPLAAQCEAGNLCLVRGSWNEDFIREATMFPNGTLKDQVDALSRAYGRLLLLKDQIVASAPECFEEEGVE